jgi:hypothetical protein
MLYYKLNDHGGFTLAAVAPPNTINAEQVMRYYRLAQGRNGGTSTGLSCIVPVLCISSHSKRNSTESEKEKFHSTASMVILPKNTGGFFREVRHFNVSSVSHFFT